MRDSSKPVRAIAAMNGNPRRNQRRGLGKVRAVVRTPWGNAEDLRDRMLSPGSAVPREEVVRNQRERLFGAMVATTADRGYAASTVADLVTLSGVSRSDFYEHFANKEDCFVGAMREILEGTSKAVSARYDGRGSALATFIELIVEQPAAARMCFVESFSAGPAAVALMDGVVAGFEVLVQQALDERTDGAEMPSEFVEAIVGGLRKVIYTRLQRDTVEELSALIEELSEWMLSYEAPTEPLRRRRRRASSAPREESHRSGDPPERIIVAATEIIAERGYLAATIGEIVERASASLSTFYEHFDSKEDVFVAALEAGQAQMFALALPAYRRAKDWPTAVRASFEAMVDFLAVHPAFAQLVMVEIFSGTTRALERRDRTVEALHAFLAPGYQRAPNAPPIAAEAIGGAVYELVYRQVRDGGAESLPQVSPLMTYIALAPFLGAKEARAVADGGGRRSAAR